MQGVGDQGCFLRWPDPPAQDAAGEDVDDEGDIDEPGQRPYVGEVGHPQLVQAGGGGPVPLDQIRVPGGGVVAAGGDRGVSPPGHPLDAGDTHEASDLVTADLDPRAAGTMMEFADPEHAQFDAHRVYSALAR